MTVIKDNPSNFLIDVHPKTEAYMPDGVLCKRSSVAMKKIVFEPVLIRNMNSHMWIAWVIDETITIENGYLKLK